MVQRLALLVGVLVCVFTLSVQQAKADRLQYLSDLVTSSAPGVYVDHRIQFQITNMIPAGGEIVINMPPGVYMPESFGIDDIDWLYATTSTSSESSFVQRTIGSSSDATTDGFAITTGSTSQFVITLNSTTGLAAGTLMRLKVGSANYQHVSNQQLRNPYDQGPYVLNFETNQPGGTPQIDFGVAAIFIINQVTVGPAAFIDNDPPVVSNIEPALDELVQAGASFIEFTFDTDEPALCRYTTVASSSYLAMGSTTNDDGAFGAAPYEWTSDPIPVVDDTEYEFFMKCRDVNGYETEEITIRFRTGVTPVGSGPDGSVGDGGGTGGGSGSGSSSGSGGGGGGGGGGSGPGNDGGGPYLFLATITIEGWSYPGSTVTILQDGDEAGTVTAGSDGSFSTTIRDLDRGIYTYGIYAEDRNGVRSATYNSTVALQSDSDNLLSGVVVPPSLAVSSSEIDPGTPLTVSGYSVPGSALTVFMQPFGSRTNDRLSEATTTALGSGLYSLQLPTNSVSIGTYQVQGIARLLTLGIESDKSAPALVGVGEAPQGDLCPRADINTDASVNLTDFSIMLFNWNTTDPVSDINLSGLVELTDFSIMLFCWTG